MPNELLVAPLLRVQMFQGLSPRQFGEIARRAERIMYRAGAFLTEEGEPADAAILIVAGETERVAAGLREPIEAGSLIGELAMLVEHTYGVTVIARGPVRALRLTRAMMHDLMHRDAALAEHMVSRIAARLGDMLAAMRTVDAALSAQEDRLSRGIEVLVSSRELQAPSQYLPSVATH